MGDHMRLNELQCKDVVNVLNGCKLGFVSDIELNADCLCVEALIVCTNTFFDYFKFFQSPQEILIPMCQVVSIGKDVILVNI